VTYIGEKRNLVMVITFECGKKIFKIETTIEYRYRVVGKEDYFVEIKNPC